MSHRNIAFSLALIGALCGLICSTAAASTLLSGYGGPGAGEQVILGSQLLNTPSPPAGAQGAASSPLESPGRAPGPVPSGASLLAETSQAEGATQTPRPAAKRAERPLRGARSGFSNPPGEPATSTQVSYDLRSGLSDGELALTVLVVACLLALALGTRGLSKLQS